MRRVRSGLERVAATDCAGRGAWRSPYTVQQADHEAQNTSITCESIVLDIIVAVWKVVENLEGEIPSSESLPMTQSQGS